MVKMRNSRFLPVLAIYQVLVVIVLLSACRGEDSTIQRPEGFPDDFPVYPGATLVHAIAEPVGTFGVSWGTSDSPDDVTAFYRSRLSQRFVLRQQTDFLDLHQLAVEDTAAEYGRGLVTISEGGSGSTIAVALGLPLVEPAPSGLATPVPAQMPLEVDLPTDYPADLVPVMDPGTIIAAETVNAGSSSVFAVTVLTSETPDQVAAFYTDELPRLGIEVSGGTEGADLVIRFEGSGVRGGITASTAGQFPGQTSVDIYIESVGAQPSETSQP